MKMPLLITVAAALLLAACVKDDPPKPAPLPATEKKTDTAPAQPEAKKEEPKK